MDYVRGWSLFLTRLKNNENLNNPILLFIGGKKSSGTVEGQERFFARTIYPAYVDNPDVTRYTVYRIQKSYNVNVRIVKIIFICVTLR